MKKKKILILPGSLKMGGAERVAANISRYAPEDTFEFHYLVFDGEKGAYGDEVEGRGGKVLSIPLPSAGYAAYVKNLYQLIKKNRYTAVHSHTMFNSGLNMAVAKVCGVPVRISHSHTTKTEIPVSPAQKIYEAVMKQLILRCSTHYYACGTDAGNWLFGQKVFARKGRILRNGIDTELFSWSEENRTRIRKQHGLEDSFVIGHTGTLAKVKNQAFLIRLLPRILERKPNAVLMLVGAGTDCDMLQALADDCGVSQNVIFTGPVFNVEKYLSAFDVFAFPSTREGTPLALLEAQANGLPCIVCANVPADAFVTDLICPLSLDDEDTWIDRICHACRNTPEVYPNILAQAGYDSQSAYQQIYETYLSTKG